MLTIRLSRKGKKKTPLYRVVINEKAQDPWGDMLETLGTYNPGTKEAVLDVDRIKYWISKGAQMSDTMWNLLIGKGVIEGKKRNVTRLSKTRRDKLAATVKADADAKVAKEAASSSAKATEDKEAEAKAEAEEKAATEAAAAIPVEAPASASAEAATEVPVAETSSSAPSTSLGATEDKPSEETPKSE